MTNTISRKTYITAALIALMSSTAAGSAFAETRDVARDNRDNVVTSTNGNCVRTMWIEGQDVCAPQVAQAQPQPTVRHQIAKEERSIYFDFDKYDIMPSAKGKLDSLADSIKSDRQVEGARIIGYADRMGSDSYNEALSQRRAKSVENYLTQRGVVNARATEVRWLGESVPATSCPDDLKRAEKIECLQKDRRVEVEIDYRPTTR